VSLQHDVGAALIGRPSLHKVMLRNSSSVKYAKSDWGQVLYRSPLPVPPADLRRGCSVATVWVNNCAWCHVVSRLAMRECMRRVGRVIGVVKVKVSGRAVLSRVQGVPSGVNTMLLARRRSMHALAACGDRYRCAWSGVMLRMVAMDRADAGSTRKAEAAAPKSVSHDGLKR
jgi:hypothetical protein